MQELFLHAMTVFAGFFAIMNPIANTPIFISLTGDDDAATKRAVARKALVFAFIVVALFCLAGSVIFRTFGITLFAFRITGGLLVFLIGFHMLQGDQSSVHKPSQEDQDQARQANLDVAISPLALPILAGPGTIATAMNFAAEGGVPGMLTTIAVFLVLCLITYGAFISGDRLVRYLGTGGINAITRLMGLILAVIGTQMVLDGVGEFVRQLG